jgi:hypothetical protein
VSQVSRAEISLPGEWGPALTARVLRAIADALDPQAASRSPGPVASSPPLGVDQAGPVTIAPLGGAPVSPVVDRRGWRAKDAAGPCLRDPSHGECDPSLTRAGDWIAYCPVCRSVRDPAKLEAARVAALHPGSAPSGPRAPEPEEESTVARIAREVAETKARMALVVDQDAPGMVISRAIAAAREGADVTAGVQSVRAAAKPVYHASERSLTA